MTMAAAQQATGVPDPRRPAPRVSIITPFLNAARFLPQAVDSVLSQTYSSWELLLVDDGSTDASSEIARELSRRFPDRIFLLEHAGHANRGISATINLGLRHARGEFVALLDSDDVWLPHKLTEQVALLDAHREAGLLYGNSLFWHSWTGNPADQSRDHAPPLGVPVDTLVQPAVLLEACLRHRAAVPCPCSVLFRRNAAEEVGGFEEDFKVLFTDQAFYAKMFLKAPVFVADRIWDKYRIHADSAVASAKRSGSVRRGRRQYLDFVARYLSDRGRARGRLWRAVRIEQWLNRHDRIEASMFALQRRWSRARARLATSVPVRLRPRVRRLLRPLGGPRFGNLRRVAPLSREFGYDRGQPVDRYYIEAFLERHASDVRGRVLEVGDDTYTRRFGGSRVLQSDVLHVNDTNPHATIVDDLAMGYRIPSNAFDCVILTQTLHLIFDVRAAIDTLFRILKPGGVVLVTAPGISQIDAGRWKETWYWSFTVLSLKRLFVARFPPEDLSVVSHGNVLVASSFLQGLAREELRQEELDASDPLYPVTLTVRARKPGISEDPPSSR